MSAPPDSGPYGMVAVMQASRTGSLPSEVGVVEFAVLVVLADHGGRDCIAWPSVAEIARQARCNEKTARKALGRLRDAGILVDVSPSDVHGAVAERLARFAAHTTPRIYRIAIPSEPLPNQGAPPKSGSPSQIREPLPKVDPTPSQKWTPPPPKSGTPPPPKSGSRSTQKITQGSTQGSTKGAGPPPRPSDPRHRELLDLWLGLAERAYGERPATGGTHGGRIAKDVSRLLEGYGGDADKVKACLERSVLDRRRPDIHAIAARPDMYQPLASGKPNTLQPAPTGGIRPNYVEV